MRERWASDVVTELAIVSCRAGIREPPNFEVPRNFFLSLLAELQPNMERPSRPILRLACPTQYDHAAMFAGAMPEYIGPRIVEVDQDLALDGLKVPVPGGLSTVRMFEAERNRMTLEIRRHGR